MKVGRAESVSRSEWVPFLNIPVVGHARQQTLSIPCRPPTSTTHPCWAIIELDKERDYSFFPLFRRWWSNGNLQVKEAKECHRYRPTAAAAVTPHTHSHYSLQKGRPTDMVLN